MLWGLWCTVVGLVGGTMPIVGVQVDGGIGLGIFMLVIGTPILTTVAYWGFALITMPIAFLLSLQSASRGKNPTQNVKRHRDSSPRRYLTEDEWREERYGENHQAERQKYVDVMRDHGGQCMEQVCVMSSRRIEPGAAWHLAHDHERGPSDYLGPAHPQCNEFEALMRGVSWSGPRRR